MIGPDPVPVLDPRPGWQATQEGYTPAVDILELLDGDIIPVMGQGLGNDGGVLYLTSPSTSGWPASDLLVPGGGFYSNGGECTVAPGAFTPFSSIANIVYGSISAGQLLSYSARALPTTPPTPGSGIIWNPWGTSAGGPLYIA